MRALTAAAKKTSNSRSQLPEIICQSRCNFEGALPARMLMRGLRHGTA